MTEAMSESALQKRARAFLLGLLSVLTAGLGMLAFANDMVWLFCVVLALLGASLQALGSSAFGSAAILRPGDIAKAARLAGMPVRATVVAFLVVWSALLCLALLRMSSYVTR